MAEHKTGRRLVEGRVIKTNSEKTRVIAIEQRLSHGLYGRILRRTVKFVAHDEDSKSKVGDLVRIQECRPMSKTKKWRLVEVIEPHTNQ